MVTAVRVEVKSSFFQTLEGVDVLNGDFRREWPLVAIYVYSKVGEQFDSEGGLSGGWQALSAAYAKRKAKTHPGKTIERRDGALEKSLRNANAPGSIYKPERDSLTLGSTLKYAKAQHFGYKKRNLPARPLYPQFTATMTRELGALVAADLTNYTKNLGLAK
jgi:hypothetical protein